MRISLALAGWLVCGTAAAETGSTGRFEFGSYGRVTVTSDGRGRTGRDSNIVAHGSRIDAPSYAELEFRREDQYSGGVTSRVVASLALFPPFFHFSGKPQQQIGVRNLYATGSYGFFNIWAGSRMYRGDDIYLLSWWPLDNQNTVGGGLGFSIPSSIGNTHIAAQAGMLRLDSPNTYQSIPSVSPIGFGAISAISLDRPHTIESLKVTHTLTRSHIASLPERGGLKFIAYGELHQLAAGVKRDASLNYESSLPEDAGWMAGAEVGYWTGERDSHVSLFVRHARGLAAYDPLGVPTTFGNRHTTAGAHETLVALGANYEIGMFGVLFGGYARMFRDASPSFTSSEKFNEGNVVVRPQLYIAENWGLAIEGSYQARQTAYAAQNGRPGVAALVRGAIFPYFSPSGRGSFKRPQIGVIYAVSARNAAARELYAQDDVFAHRTFEHFVGVTAEWWFNSSTYP